MPVVPYVNQLEPPEDAVIWRYMDLRKFRDLMASEELYFRRADLFTDRSEGLPPEDYAMRVLGLDPYDLRDRGSLNDHLGALAQNREAYYVTCWYWFQEDTLDMWEQYGHDGVAVCSRYDSLKTVLNGLLDKAHIGLVQYGTKHLTNRFNALEFITTKRAKDSLDREVRAFITCCDPLASGSRHIDLNNGSHRVPLELNPRHAWVPECKRRRIDLRSLITGVVISPWAEPDVAEEIGLWGRSKGFPASIRPSELTSASTPTLAEYRKVRHLASGREPEPHEDPLQCVPDADLQHFQDSISRLSLSRLRFLYRQRWDACRLSPDVTPDLGQVQYLERTLRAIIERQSCSHPGQADS